ncbi:hypothetical protein MRX96_037666 [Rhipicephalus microplus]
MSISGHGGGIISRCTSPAASCSGEEDIDASFGVQRSTFIYITNSVLYLISPSLERAAREQKSQEQTTFSSKFELFAWLVAM